MQCAQTYAHSEHLLEIGRELSEDGVNQANRWTPAIRDSSASQAQRRRPPYFAIPKNKAKHRSISTRASSPMRPKAGPTLSRLTVMALSTITWEGFCKPFLASGWTVTRSSGAATTVPVTGSTVTLACSLNWSDWTTRAGLSLPKSPCREKVTK